MTDPSAAELETPVCPICGPGATADLRYDFAPYHVVRCTGCGLDYLSPRLTEAAILKLYRDEAYYRSSVTGQGYDEYLDAGRNWERTFTLRLKQIAPHVASGRALDIGCGPGYFLAAAQRRGFDVHGLDPSDYIVREAARTWGDRVRLGTVETATYEAESFDLITAFDTFEHVYDPVCFLETVHRWLGPGGVLAITTPDPTSLLARLSGRRWVSFKIPEHVTYWSPATLRRVLAPRFEPLEFRRAGQVATAGFLFRRLFRVPGEPGRLLGALVGALNRVSLYADNGSVTAIARKR